MTEAEKLDAGLEYDFTEPEVRGRKFRAVKGCQKLNGIDMTETAAREAAIRELFGSAGKSPVVLPTFHCDNGENIHVGDNFFANYNVTILDNREVRIGDNVMIGPHTLIATVGHPLSRHNRHIAANPHIISNDDRLCYGTVHTTLCRGQRVPHCGNKRMRTYHHIKG